MGASVSDLELVTAEPPRGLPLADASLTTDEIHFVDTAQALSHVLTHLKQVKPQYVGVDLEWTDPCPVSLIQIATPSRAFVIDVVGKTELYMSVVWDHNSKSVGELWTSLPLPPSPRSSS